MSFSFKFPFRLKRGYDDKDFDGFLQYFNKEDIYSSAQLLKRVKNAVRLWVLKGDYGMVLFDSSLSKDSTKADAIHLVGQDQINVAKLAFGSCFLNTTKDLLYSVKLHCLSPKKQILITRVLCDINEWRSHETVVKRKLSNRRLTSLVPELTCRTDSTRQNSIAVCVLVNTEALLNHNESNMKSPPHGTPANRRTALASLDPDVKDAAGSQANCGKNSVFKQFHRTLFEHCTQLSVVVEILARKIFSALHRLNRQCATGTYTNAQCSEAITKAFSHFLKSFRDFYIPKLSFPIWSTLNTMLMTRDYLSGYVAPDMRSLLPDGSDSAYDSLSDIFVRGCAYPLLKNGKEARNFLSQLLTGMLMLHPGWISTATPAEWASFMPTRANHTWQSPDGITSANTLLRQTLSQIGCSETTLESGAGSVFNCTVLTGQSKKYMLALLYFATYFLRFSSLCYARESVPDLGKSDLLDVTQQRRQSTCRKSGSTACIAGDAAHDSGISSQEDLPTIHSVSTGSSPTHASGMALCMPYLLSEEQCRLAVEMANATACREMQAANQQSRGPRTEHDVRSASSGTMNAPHLRYTEVPLLFEKRVAPDEEPCSCIPRETPTLPFITASGNGGSSGGYPYEELYSAPRTITARRRPSRTISESSPIYAHTRLSNSPSRPSFPSSSWRGDLRHDPPSHHSSGQQLGVAQSPVVSAPSVINHVLIGNGVSDQFYTGLVLQAVSESPDNFRPRMEEQLSEWAVLGSIIVRGMNLSSRSSDIKSSSTAAVTNSSGNNTSDADNLDSIRMVHVPELYASGLIANADNRTVELTVIRQRQRSESGESSADTTLATSSVHLASRDTTVSGAMPWPVGRRSTGRVRRPSNVTDVPVRQSPLIVKLLERCCTVFERTNCSLLMLKEIEMGLQVLHAKSRILVDYIVSSGSTVFDNTSRMAIVAGCSVDDLPLLLATASAYSVPAASLMSMHHPGWPLME